MYDFILRIALVISLSAMIYLLARVVARVKDEDFTHSEEDFIDKWLAQIPVAKIDNWLHLTAAKFLRRLRVIVLKFDNLLHGYLMRIKKTNDATVGLNPTSLVEHLTEEKKKK